MSPAIPLYPISDYARDRRRAGSLFAVHFYETVGLKAYNRYVPHRHDFFEIFWVRKGSGEFRLDLETHRFGPNSLLFIAPRRVHYWTIETKVEGEIIGFTEDLFAPDSDGAHLLAKKPLIGCPGQPPLLRLAGKDRRVTNQLFGDLRRETETADNGREASLRALLTILLVQIHRLSEDQPPPEAARTVSLLAWLFHLKLAENFPRLQKVSDYAKLLRVSRSHLNDCLRQEVGQTASDLIHSHLMLEAKRLLMHSTLTVSEIAYRLQFRDPSYFVRFFRRHTALTPGRFRASTQPAPGRD